MVRLLPILSLVLVLTMTVVVACSRSPSGKETLTQLPGVAGDAHSELYSLYDPKSLVEAKAFAEMPEGVRVLANSGGMEASGEGPGGRLQQFMIGGVGPTSALMAYEQFGFIPTYGAVAYVYSGTKWVSVRKWAIRKVGTLKEAIEMTSPESK